MAEIREIGVARPIPENKTLGAIARGFKQVRDDFDTQFTFKDWVPLIGGQGIGSLLVGQAPEELQRWAEGNSPFVEARNVGRAAIPTPTFKTGRRDPVYDVGFVALDAIPIAGAAGKAGAKAAGVVADKATLAGQELMRRAADSPVAAAAAEEIVKRAERGLFGVPGTGATMRTHVIKPEGENWHEPASVLTNKYAPYKQRESDIYDEWLSQYPDQLDDNVILERAYNTALNRKAEILKTLSKEQRETVEKHDEALDNLIRSNNGDAPEIDGAEWYNIENELVLKITRENPQLSFEDRIALTFNPYDYDSSIHGPLGDATQHYKNIAADAIAKEEGIQTLSDLFAQKAVARQWFENVVPKYVEKKMATPSDPLRKAVDEGRYIPRVNLTPEQMADEIARDEFLKIHRAGNESAFTRLNQIPPPPEGVAKTILGKYHEAQTDRSIGYVPLRDLMSNEHQDLYGLFDPQKYPWVNENTPGDTKFYRMRNNPYLDQTLSDISKEARLLVDEGKITPNNFQRWTVDQVAAESTKRRLEAERLEGATKKQIAQWAEARLETVPTDQIFPDGSRMVQFSKETVGDDVELLKRDLSLHTCFLEHCVGSAGRTPDNTKYLTMVSPATGQKTKGSSGTGIGYGYVRDIMDGSKEIRALLNEKGLPEATLEFIVTDKPSAGYSGTFSIDQIRGFDNGEVPEKFHKNIVQYLNTTPGIEYVDDLVFIGAHEASSGHANEALMRTLAGLSTTKYKKLLKELAMGWNRQQAKYGGTYFSEARSIIDDIVNNDMLNGDHRFVLDKEANETYSAIFKRYLNNNN